MAATKKYFFCVNHLGSLINVFFKTLYSFLEQNWKWQNSPWTFRSPMPIQTLWKQFNDIDVFVDVSVLDVPRNRIFLLQ